VPVCVTANRDIDLAIEMARQPDVILTTFGDMMKVPGSYSSLSREKAEGRDVRVVYSPLDSLTVAEREPDKHVVFLGVGFETTAPTSPSPSMRLRAAGSPTGRRCRSTRRCPARSKRSSTTPRCG